MNTVNRALSSEYVSCIPGKFYSYYLHLLAVGMSKCLC